MATLDEAIEKGHSRYFKNPHWRGVYDEAPNDAQAYYDLIFSQLDGGSEPALHDEFKSRMDQVYEALSDGGWDYIIDHTENRMGKWGLRQAREKFQKS